ncbi:hypothetical protein EVAR_25041_1 [Eumeta japonica]|uniref:Uncharacterized protein n=1 Tax=Eumeta variegata TaxID=151549 RepID=A0A4C1V6G7_EUMVA|nr:hypothetical protein EVAR_25041_1 [Eumeta japonica]
MRLISKAEHNWLPLKASGAGAPGDTGAAAASNIKSARQAGGEGIVGLRFDGSGGTVGVLRTIDAARSGIMDCEFHNSERKQRTRREQATQPEEVLQISGSAATGGGAVAPELRRG